MDQQQEPPQSPRRVHAQHGIGDVAHPVSPNTAAVFARAKKRALEQRYRIASHGAHDGNNDHEDEIIWEPNEPRLPWESAVGSNNQVQGGEANLKRMPLSELNSSDGEVAHTDNPLSPTLQRLNLAKAKQRELRERIAKQKDEAIDLSEASDTNSEEDRSGVCEAKDNLERLATTTKLDIELLKIPENRVSDPAIPLHDISSMPYTRRIHSDVADVRHSSQQEGILLPRDIFVRRLSDTSMQTNSRRQLDVRKRASSSQVRTQPHDCETQRSSRDLRTDTQQSRGSQNRILVNASERTDSTKSMSERSSTHREDTTRLHTRERQDLMNSSVRRSGSRLFLAGGDPLKTAKPGGYWFIRWIKSGNAPRTEKNYEPNNHRQLGSDNMKVKQKSLRSTRKLKMLDPVRQLCTKSKPAKQVFSPDAHFASTEATAMMMDRLILSK